MLRNWKQILMYAGIVCLVPFGVSLFFFTHTGLGYLAMPITGLFMGYVCTEDSRRDVPDR